MPPRKARRTANRGPAKSETSRPIGPPRVLCAHDVRVGAVPDGLPALSGEAAAVAAGASLTTWESLLDAAVADADGLILTGRTLAAAADLRAEQALRTGLDRAAAAGVTVFAVTAEPLPDGLPVTILSPDEPSETELTRGTAAVAAVRVLAGRGAFPVPDGLPVLGIVLNPAADADGCDAAFVPAEATAPGALVTLPETAGGGGVKEESRGVRPVRFLAPVLDLTGEPDDLAAALRDAAPERTRGERLRVVRWTLRVGPGGDRLLNGEAAGALAAALSGPRAVHEVTAVPHPDRFDGDGEEAGEAAAFLEALSHFDPLGEPDDAPAVLAGLAPDPERVRTLATRFAAPLLTND